MSISRYEGLTWLNRGRFSADPYWLERDFKYYGITYVHRGEVALSVNRKEPWILRGPVAWIYFPGVHFAYGVKTGTWDNRFINFKGPLIQEYISCGLISLNSETPFIGIRQPDLFRKTFDELFDYLENPRRNHNRSVYRMEGLLLLMREQEQINHLSSLENAIWEICDRIRKNEHEQFEF